MSMPVIKGCSLGIEPPNAIQGLSRERERYPRYARTSYTITFGLDEFEMKAENGSGEVRNQIRNFRAAPGPTFGPAHTMNTFGESLMPQVFMMSCGWGVRPRSRQWPGNPNFLGERHEWRHVGCSQ